MDDSTIDKKNSINEKTTAEIIKRLMKHRNSNVGLEVPPGPEDNNNMTGFVDDKNSNEYLKDQKEPAAIRTVKAPIITPPLLSAAGDEVVMINHIVHQKRDKIPERINVTNIIFQRVHRQFMECKKRSERVTDNMLFSWAHEEKNCLWMDNSLTFTSDINDRWIQSFKNFYGIGGPPIDLNFIAFNSYYQQMYYHDYSHYAGKQQQHPQQNLQQLPEQKLQFPQQNLQLPQQQQQLQQLPQQNFQKLPQQNLQQFPQQLPQQFPQQPPQHLRQLLQQPLTPLPQQLTMNNNNINITNSKPSTQPANKIYIKKEPQIQKNQDTSPTVNYDNYNRVTPSRAPYNTPISKRNQRPPADELNFNNGVVDNNGEPLLDLSCERKRKRADSDPSSSVDKKTDDVKETAAVDADADPKI